MEKSQSEQWSRNYFGCGFSHADEALRPVPVRKSEFTSKTERHPKAVRNYFGCGLDDREGTEDAGNWPAQRRHC